MSTNNTTELTIARQKKNIAWILFAGLLSLATYTTYHWYNTPNTYTSESTVSVPGENTPADFWTNTGLVSAKTKATEIISSEAFIANTFTQTPGPVFTSVNCDYTKHIETSCFPFEIRVKKTPVSGQQSFEITDAGDNSYLLKGKSGQTQKSFIGTYGTEVTLGDYILTVNKRSNTEAIQPIQTEVVYAFTLMSSQAITQYLLSGNGKVDVSQINDVIQVSVSAQGDEVASSIANTLATAYVNTNNQEPHNTTSIQSAEKVTPQAEDQPKQEHTEEFGTTIALLTRLEETLLAQEKLTRNIRERIDEDYSNLSTDGINHEGVERSMKKLGDLYDRLDRHPEDADIISSITERKEKIGNDLIAARKETAQKIEDTKNKIKELGENQSDIANMASTQTPTNDSKTLNASIGAMVIPTTTMEAEKNTPVWAWWTALVGFALIFLTNRVTVFQNRYRLLTAAGEAKQTKTLPVTYPVKTILGTNVALTQPVENLCAEILTKEAVKTITVSSLKPGEGKSFVTSRLAMSLAALDKKVLVIDMSFHKPSLSKTLACETEQDITDVASGQCQLLQAIAPTSLPGMDLLRAGRFEHGIRGFLAWAERDLSFKQLRNYYDYILIDTDDVSSGPEAVTFLKMSDLNLFIDGSGANSKDRNEKIADFASEKGLLNTFVVPNIITKKAHVNKPVKTAEKSAKKTMKPTTEEQDNYNRDDAEQKPSFLKRVALWFF